MVNNLDQIHLKKVSEQFSELFFSTSLSKRTKEVVIFHLNLTEYCNERNKKCNKAYSYIYN